MSIAEEVADDWEEVEGIETVTLIATNRAENEKKGVKALRGSMKHRELMLAQQLNMPLDSVVFILFTNTMGTFVPQPMDKIQAGQERFTIKHAKEGRFGTPWRCMCSKL